MIKAFIPENDIDEIIANTYVLGQHDKGCVVVDLGNPSEKISDYVKNNFKKCWGILLTHAHLDHTRAVDAFLSRFDYDIPVYLHEDDYEMLMDDSLSGAADGEHYVPNFDPKLIKDNQILNFGDAKIKVIHTPFHTRGSVCYLSEEDNALFTGDTLFAGSVGRTDLPGGDENAMIPSLMKLKELSDFLAVYPGHGKTTNLGFEKKNNHFLQ